MKRHGSKGFTIIEVLLFLAITGALVASVLLTTGGTINSQRYKESVASLESTLQKQYSSAINTNNERGDNITCDSNAKVSASASAKSQGQSDCVILGRAIRLSGAGHDLSIKDVIGYTTDSLSTVDNDLEAFKKYQMQLPADGLEWPNETYNLEWGSSIGFVIDNNLATANQFTILVLRSPISGVVRTYIDKKYYADNQIRSGMINSTTLVKSLELCIDSNGLIDSSRGLMSVKISSDATSAEGVEIIGEGSSKCN